MEVLKINGGIPLTGAVKLHGAKNSSLPILSASILVNGVTTIHNCPNLSDVRETLKIIEELGASVSFEDNTAVIDATNINKSEIAESTMRLMRSSILFLGSLLSRNKQASIYLPGGCDIGVRPIDLHIKSLKRLGASIKENGSHIECTAQRFIGAKIILPFPSVGATENIMIASAVSKGKTTIVNPAREPEICDLADFLNKCGARIYGAGESVIEIEGVTQLHPCEHTIIPDRILASTYMSACQITGGDVLLENVKPTNLNPIFPVFNEMGAALYLKDNTLRIKAPKRSKRVRMIKTMPYPGFPTDSQSIIIACLSVSKGTSVVSENIFENRYRFVSEFNRFGSDIEVNNKLAIVNGVKELHPANVYSTDLRGGAALVIGALGASGESTVNNISLIDRGYEKIEDNLKLLGADIKRINDEKQSKIS